MTNFTRHADNVIKKIRFQLLLPLQEREKGLDDERLQYALDCVLEMKKNFETGNLPPNSLRHATLGYWIIDQWPLGTELGTAIIELEDLYIKL